MESPNPGGLKIAEAFLHLHLPPTESGFAQVVRAPWRIR